MQLSQAVKTQAKSKSLTISFSIASYVCMYVCMHVCIYIIYLSNYLLAHTHAIGNGECWLYVLGILMATMSDWNSWAGADTIVYFLLCSQISSLPGKTQFCL